MTPNNNEWLPAAVPANYELDSDNPNYIEFNESIISFRFPPGVNSFKQLYVRSNHSLDFYKSGEENGVTELANHTVDYPLFIYKPQIDDSTREPDYEKEKWPYLHFSPNVSIQSVNVDEEND